LWVQDPQPVNFKCVLLKKYSFTAEIESKGN